MYRRERITLWVAMLLLITALLVSRQLASNAFGLALSTGRPIDSQLHADYGVTASRPLPPLKPELAHDVSLAPNLEPELLAARQRLLQASQQPAGPAEPGAPAHGRPPEPLHPAERPRPARPRPQPKQAPQDKGRHQPAPDKAAGPPAKAQEQGAGPAAQPKPKPAAQPKPKPAAQPKPKPAAQPKPKPAAQPKPKPAAQPKPRPAPDPGPPADRGKKKP